MSPDELKIKTRYQFGFPYHSIFYKDMVVVNLLEKNYKLAKKIKKLLSENTDLIFGEARNEISQNQS